VTARRRPSCIATMECRRTGSAFELRQRSPHAPVATAARRRILPLKFPGTAKRYGANSENQFRFREQRGPQLVFSGPFQV
jgi:hypothetical protein